MDDQNDDRYARAPEPADVVRICRALNEAGARHLLIGGLAVVAHGGGRFTKDVDLLVDDAPENVARASCAWPTRSWWTSSGGPADSTRVLPLFIYQTAFEFFKMGRAAAMSVFLFVAMMIFTIFQIRLFSHGEEG